MTIPLQSAIAYGPIRSRRFGVSLGINLLSNVQKICNFDCVYCQYDTAASAPHAEFPDVREIASQTAARLDEMIRTKEAVDCITIAGNGEPTLHPKFGAVVDALIEVRDLLSPGLPITILSNSSTCHRSNIREALAKLDGRFMKLDAGRETVFREVNLPAASIGWDELVDSLASMKRITLQSMFFEGKIRNTDPAAVNDWIDAVGRIRPDEAQIYTIDRPPRETGLIPAAFETLEDISSRLFERTGIRGNVFAKDPRVAA
jgi:wyosine [tRNA(Phe)-imidazoG37] synthetase (radical SAM superfamily)